MKKKHKSRKTPWGKAQTETVIAPGIVKYTTASHGGYYVSAELNALVPKSLKKATFGRMGVKGWYEEDADWAIVVYIFSDRFDQKLKEAALHSLQEFHTEALNSLLRDRQR